MTPNQFIRRLSQYTGDHVFNPYSDRCAIEDRFDAPKVRRGNLRSLLQQMTTSAIPCDLWIGRDLGYLGGRRTGLALTAETHFALAERRWGIVLKQATKGQLVHERSAAAVWKLLGAIQYPVMMWNVFPFHPHEPQYPFSNRSHTAAEREVGLAFLQALVSMLGPRQIVAIGNDAAKIANLAFPDATVVAVRHPSYGGNSQFTKQVEALYQVRL